MLSEYYEVLAENGRHGHQRGLDTCRKHIEVIQCAWAWVYDNDEDWPNLVPRPRRLKMPRGPGKPAVAPKWAEMDACIQAGQGFVGTKQDSFLT